MRQRTHIEQAKFELLKATRAAIRTKYAVLADREINDVLPSIEQDFDIRVNRGELPEAAASAAFGEALSDG